MPGVSSSAIAPKQRPVPESAEIDADRDPGGPEAHHARGERDPIVDRERADAGAEELDHLVPTGSFRPAPRELQGGVLTSHPGSERSRERDSMNVEPGDMECRPRQHAGDL